MNFKKEKLQFAKTVHREAIIKETKLSRGILKLLPSILTIEDEPKDEKDVIYFATSLKLIKKERRTNYKDNEASRRPQLLKEEPTLFSFLSSKYYIKKRATF